MVSITRLLEDARILSLDLLQQRLEVARAQKRGDVVVGVEALSPLAGYARGSGPRREDSRRPGCLRDGSLMRPRCSIRWGVRLGSVPRGAAHPAAVVAQRECRDQHDDHERGNDDIRDAERSRAAAAEVRHAPIVAADNSVPMLVPMLISPWAVPRSSAGASSIAIERNAPPTSDADAEPHRHDATRKPTRP